MKLTKRSFLAGSGATMVSTAVSVANESTPLHRCGLVEMRTTPDGGVGMYGWDQLAPNEKPVFDPERGARFIVTASFRDKIMEVHEGQHGVYFPVAIWPVVTPEPYELPGTVFGSVYQIDMLPEWYPSNSLREKYEAYRAQHPEEALPPLPSGSVPYGHAGNPMGERKIRANWSGRYDPSAVLHGTTGYPVELCEVDTAGCVRLYNDWIIDLVDRILGGPENAIASGTDLIITPQSIKRAA